MKRLYLILIIFSLCLYSCDKKEEVETFKAKGYVLGKTGVCEGNALYIEVEHPKGIGKKGTFHSLWGKDNPIWNYENAIGVPHFDKVNLPVSLMQEGTFLHFEYRKYDSGKDSHYFAHKQYCTMEKGPPPANLYVITKIILHEFKEK